MSLFDEIETDEPVTRFNHCSNDYGKWVEYNGWRFKDLYSIETRDGVVFPLARPNGNGWYLQREIACTREEYEALAPEEDVPYKALPESIYYEVERGRIDDKDVVRIALVPDEQLPFNGYHLTGKRRIQHNRRMFAGSLSLDEGNLQLGPSKATVKYLSFVVTPDKSVTEHLRRYGGPVKFEDPDFVRQPDGTFTFQGSQVIELIPEYFETRDKFIRVLFQRGWRFKGVLDFDVSVKEDDTLAPFKTKLRQVEILKQGRTDSPAAVVEQLQAADIQGVLHFTFYYD